MTDRLSPRILDTLRQLGLTEYGAKCYVALLSLKDAEASSIAEAAEVPRTKVYATLKDLADDGWVVAQGGRPVRYKPIAPDERIARAEKRIAEDAEAATRELQARFSLGAQMVPMSAYMLRGRASIDAKTADLLHRAREELLLNLGFLLPGEERQLIEGLRSARERGVRIRLLLGPGIDPKPFGDLAKDARIAVFPFRGIVCDWRQVLLALPAMDGEPIAMWNPTQTFLDLFGPMLRQAAESAPPLR